MKPITEPQAEYIEIMLTNRFVSVQDKEAVTKHLSNAGNTDISELTASEASDLIKELLYRDVEYEFLCGKTKTMKREEGHRLDLFGEHEACGHHCTEDIYFANCEHFQAYDRAMYAGLDKE